MQIDGPSPSPSDFADFARVAALDPALQQSAAGVAAAIALSSDEVAVAAAAIELIEAEHGAPAILADMLLLHARNVFHLQDGGVEALQRLADAGLIYVQANNHAAAAVPTWRSVETVQVIIGRAAAELGRMPIPRIASQVFAGVLRQRLGGFDMARFGVGRLSLGDATRQVEEFHQRERDGTRRIGLPPTGLFIRASYSTVPIHACVSFDAAGDRDAAAKELDGLSAELWNEEFAVSDVVALPVPVVPSLRFVRAITWLEGRNFSSWSLRPDTAHREMSLVEEAHFRYQVREWIRGRLSAAELLPYELELPTGYATWADDDTEVIIEILGANSVVSLRHLTGILPPGPYVSLQVAEQLGLSAGQTVGRMLWRQGSRRREDPVTGEVVELQKLAAASNKGQSRREVLLEEATLGSMLRESLDLRVADARSLVGAIPDAGLSEPQPFDTLLVLMLKPPERGWVDGARSVVHRVEIPSQTGEHGVHFKIATAATESRIDTVELVSSTFGVDIENPRTVASGVATTSLSSLLGFARDEVRFTHPESSVPGARANRETV